MLARKNHWMRIEIPMKDNITQWRGEWIPANDERKVVKRSLGFFATAASGAS